jgi:hypothetical protein
MADSYFFLKSIAGIVLVALVLVTLAAVPLWTVREGFIDFLCKAGRSYTASTFPPEQRRIIYCISSWPRNVFGGSVYAHGESNQDEVILKARHFWQGDITLQRDGATLVVNGRQLQKGEAYRALRFFPSSNLWLLLTAEWRIGNGGLHANPVSEGPLRPKHSGWVAA